MSTRRICARTDPGTSHACRHPESVHGKGGVPGPCRARGCRGGPDGTPCPGFAAPAEPARAPGLRVSRRAQDVHVAQAELGVLLDRFQRERRLTDIEMLQGLVGWQASVLKYMLRAERHPDDPDRPADVADDQDLFPRFAT